jgi:hypothetical protein
MYFTATKNIRFTHKVRFADCEVLCPETRHVHDLSISLELTGLDNSERVVELELNLESAQEFTNLEGLIQALLSDLKPNYPNLFSISVELKNHNIKLQLWNC